MVRPYPIFSTADGSLCGDPCTAYLRGLIHAYNTSEGILWFSPTSGISMDLGNILWDVY